ncbi:uncharacterized protein BDZ99DRAFT_481965 [Mytilinidion resinicola]|uniref:Uncharacterized protein n=1 Tax=Mytilinidion resinicola TaxID=574789 RepID=A0A6A6Y4V1_9PEZI|nr:uncharacterized protein BDZ99DRAFT_481965 [Mytilinidion resinicola]KAF2803543.1 hypothetical protein BDZ99DRAFT_481965 [Mytilinidion resinicola]
MTAEKFALVPEISKENNEKPESNVQLTFGPPCTTTSQLHPFTDTTRVSNPFQSATTPPTYPQIASTTDPASDLTSRNDPGPAHDGSSLLTESNLSAHDSSLHHEAARSDRDRKEGIKKAATELGFKLADDDIPPLHEGKTPMEFWMAES